MQQVPFAPKLQRLQWRTQWVCLQLVKDGISDSVRPRSISKFLIMTGCHEEEPKKNPRRVLVGKRFLKKGLLTTSTTGCRSFHRSTISIGEDRANNLQYCIHLPCPIIFKELNFPFYFLYWMRIAISMRMIERNLIPEVNCESHSIIWLFVSF